MKQWRQKWANLSLPGKLFSFFVLFALLIVIQLSFLSFAMETLSGSRALVKGESSWSKAQKDAVNALQTYIVSGKPEFYEQFQKSTLIPLGCRMVREEVLRREPNQARLFKGYLQGNTDPDDIVPITKLLRRFSWDPQIQETMLIWARADEMMDQLIETAHGIHNRMPLPPDEIKSASEGLAAINSGLTEAQFQFSENLAQGSKKMEQTLWTAVLVLVLTGAAIGFYLVYCFGRALARGLNELGEVARQIGHGELDRRATVHSKDEVGQLATSINSMADELQMNIGKRVQAEHANQVKNLFLANVSHEIRTPLGSIIGFARLLEEPDLAPAERAQYIEIIQRAGINLTNVVNDILDVSKIESGRLEIVKKKVPLRQVVDEIHSLFSLKSDEKDLQFKIHFASDIPGTILTDPHRLKQVLQNLLGNAIKFTKTGGVDLFVSHRGSQLFFDVKDTGPGIAEHDKEIIFEPFEQGDVSETRGFGGTGLGLSISRHLATLLGGSLTLMNSKLGEGSHFRLSIPCDQDAAPEESVAPAYHPEKLVGLKVLVVDDSVDNRKLVEKLLRSKKIEVDLAVNGEEALAKVTNGKYDVMILDLQMPVMGGLEAIRRMRAEGINTHGIALTARTLAEDADECFAAGFDEFLRKPISEKLLFRAIENGATAH